MNNKKYFGTDGIRGRVGEDPITAEFMLHLGYAVGAVFAHEGTHTVLIGKDTRISGYMFESALEAGLSAAGVNVGLLGVMPTPGIAYLTQKTGAIAGIVISASHNPYTDNGIKFFCDAGGKLSDELEYAIEAQLAKPIKTVAPDKLGKAHRVQHAQSQYQQFCADSLAHRLDGLKIVIDCAHGATYHIAPPLFQSLGAEVVTIGAAPNGLNINDGYGSTQPLQLQQQVLVTKADLGIAFDGDGDRVIMVDHLGQIVDGDRLLYILAKYRNGTKSGVVGTLMSNFGLERSLEALQIPFMRAHVGDRFVLELLRQQGWQLGGEPSGHILCLDKTTTGDGIIAALQVLAVMVAKQQGLHELSQD
ncbi:MAG TPA: phosphoglucosamine mutase, partial [Gammaproteobacteria bacterium]|nr:phosphoglucosamine mutase [Gammaproteobacteria bacterium]